MDLGASDYRIYLRQALAERSTQNPLYSMRAMARDLKIAPSKLSEILSGKRGLSREKGLHIGKALSLSEEEILRFCDLIEASHARSPQRRRAAALRLGRRSSSPHYLQLQMDAFHAISDWYHLPIIELTKLKNFKSDVAWIARTLGIRKLEAELAIERLRRLKLLRAAKGRLVARPFHVASPSGIPSEAIRKFHRQILQKAAQALGTQTLDERDFSGIVFACDEKDLPEIKNKLKAFRRDVADQAEGALNKNRVYCLSLQLFRVDQKEIS